MKRITFLVFLLSYLSFSQNKQILYGFSEIPQSLMLNPGGEVENDWYFGIPLISHFHASAGVSGSTLYDVFADDGINFNVKLKNAIYGMKANDFYTVNEQLEIFSGGFAFGSSYDKNKYISFGLYQEFDFISYFPKDYAILAYEGNQNNINRRFDAGDLSLRGEMISVFHVGFNKKVNRQFTYGVRGKIYSGVMDVSSTKNKGSFITTQGQNNFYNHIFDLDLELKTSGIVNLTNEGSDSESVMKDLKKGLLLGGNLGLGFDIGFTYQLSKQWSLDASLLDVGFISHSKNVENYTLKNQYTFEGIDPLFPEGDDTQKADDYWSDIEDAFEDLFTVDTTTTKYTSWRPIKLNASLNYSFGKKRFKACNCLQDEQGYQNAVGAQLFAIKRPKGPQMALTTYFYRQLFNGLSAKATYTIDSYSFKNIGLGVSAHLGNLNFYLMADNFLEYKNIYNAQSVSLQLGFNYIFNKNED
jgi:hypothetical protein